MLRVEENSTNMNYSVGNVVATTKHSHRMTIHGISHDSKAKCQYFIGLELLEETHCLTDLAFISK